MSLLEVRLGARRRVKRALLRPEHVYEKALIIVVEFSSSPTLQRKDTADIGRVDVSIFCPLVSTPGRSCRRAPGAGQKSWGNMEVDIKARITTRKMTRGGTHNQGVERRERVSASICKGGVVPTPDSMILTSQDGHPACLCNSLRVSSGAPWRAKLSSPRVPPDDESTHWGRIALRVARVRRIDVDARDASQGLRQQGGSGGSVSRTPRCVLGFEEVQDTSGPLEADL